MSRSRRVGALVAIAFALGIAPDAVAARESKEPRAPSGAESRSPSGAESRRLLVTVEIPAAAAVGGGGTYRRPAGYGRTGALDGVLDRIAREHALRRIDGWTMRALDVWCEVFEAPDAAARDEAIAALARDPRVESAQPLQRFEAQAAADPYRDLQSNALGSELAAAHRVARGRGIRIAVIDSGVDATHRDLRGAIGSRRDFVGGGERGAHGTAVAGIIGARAENGVGITGVAPEAQLADLRACWVEGGRTACNSYTLARALDAALAERVGIINLSLAGPDDPLLARLLAVAEKRGIVVVAAVPAGSAVAQAFPARLASVLAVVERERSEPGAVRAPGTGILTTLPGDRYDFASGSSIAAAHVSGAAALYRETSPGATPAKVRAALRAWTGRSLAQVLLCGRRTAAPDCSH